MLFKNNNFSSMDDITNVKWSPLENSRYVKPVRFEYVQNGVHRSEVVSLHHNCAVILLYHMERDALVFVKQFRPAVYYNRILELDPSVSSGCVDPKRFPGSLGVTLELCAGILDKPGLSSLETAAEEVLEECGYIVSLDKLQKVVSYSGATGARVVLYFAEVNESMKAHDGGGVHDERIEVVYIKTERALQLIYDESIPKPPSFGMALLWFARHKGLKVPSQ